MRNGSGFDFGVDSISAALARHFVSPVRDELGLAHAFLWKYPSNPFKVVTSGAADSLPLSGCTPLQTKDPCQFFQDWLGTC
jgi:hypothetical protein